MKKKLALLMAAIMTVAMVPMTAFAATDYLSVEEVKVGTDSDFTSVVQFEKKDTFQTVTSGVINNPQTGVPVDVFEVMIELENAKFTEDEDDIDNNVNTE